MYSDINIICKNQPCFHISDINAFIMIANIFYFIFLGFSEIESTHRQLFPSFLYSKFPFVVSLLYKLNVICTHKIKEIFSQDLKKIFSHLL